MRAAALALAVLAVLAASAAAQNCSSLYSVPNFDVTLYTGGWYEIATSRFVYGTFERNCYCVKANYTLTTDNTGKAYVIVNNQCRRGSVAAPADEIIGRADQNNPSAPGELSVTFGPVPATSANYYVMEIGPAGAYSASNPDAYVLVGEPCRRALWILARRPIIDDRLFDSLVATAEKNGYDVESIRFRNTVQDGCGWVYPRV